MGFKEFREEYFPMRGDSEKEAQLAQLMAQKASLAGRLSNLEAYIKEGSAYAKAPGDAGAREKLEQEIAEIDEKLKQLQ